MKSINVEVGGLVSSLSAEGVRRKLLQLPGVHHADVNYVAGSATVHLDEGQLSVEDLRQRIAEHAARGNGSRETISRAGAALVELAVDTGTGAVELLASIKPVRPGAQALGKQARHPFGGLGRQQIDAIDHQHQFVRIQRGFGVHPSLRHV